MPKRRRNSRATASRLPTPSASRWTILGLPGVLVLAFLAAFGIGAFLYKGALTFPFEFDDESYLLINPLLTKAGSFLSIFDFQKIRTVFQDQQLNFDVGTNFILRPFTYFTFYLNHLAAGSWNPAGCRLVNLGLHCFNGFLVFGLISSLLRLSPKARDLSPSSMLFIPAAAATMFLVHPMQVESVTYIVQRFTSLGTMFYLITLLLYFHAGTKTPGLWRAASMVTLLAGMLSKEEVFTAPLLLVLLDHWVMNTAWKPALRRALPHLVCMALIPTLIAALAVSDHAKNGAVLHAVSIAAGVESWDYHFTYLLTETRVVVGYLGLLLTPLRMNVDWDVSPSTSLLDGRVLSCGALIVAMLAGGWFFFKRKPLELRHALLFSSVVWFFLTLAVSSSLIPLSDFMAEHRVYLPSIGIFTALACGADLLRTEFFKNRQIAWAVPVAIGMWAWGLAAATSLRNEVWRSGISLWTDAVLKSPGKYRAWGNLGVCYGTEGRLEEAQECFEKAISLQPDYAMGYRNLAVILTRRQKYAESIEVSQKGLGACGGDDPAMAFNIAAAYNGMGDLDDGERTLHKILADHPNLLQPHLCLGDIYTRQTKFDAALSEYRIAAQLAPEDERVSKGLSEIQSKMHSL